MVDMAVVLQHIQSVDMATVLQIIGITGVLTTNALALTNLKPVLEARREGSLAGLDVRLWPLSFMNQMLWTGYSIVLGDVWLFLSSFPAAIMWLFFCITVVELLSQEEGELTPISPRTVLKKQDLFRRSTAMSFDDLDNIHIISKNHRRHLILKTERFVLGGLLFSGLVSFALTPDRFLGFPMISGLLPEETRNRYFGYVCMTVSFACNVEPIKKVRGMIKSRDASTVFLPNAFAALFNTAIWFAYGVLTGSPALIVPLSIGGLNWGSMLVLRCIFGGGSQVDTETDASPTGALSGDVTGIQDGPQPARFGHQRLGSTSSNPSVVNSAVSARSFTKLVSGSARSSTTCHESDIANLSDLDMFQSESTVAASTIGATDHLPTKANELPDLSGRLREMGVYEDYLKWQRDYQRWRKGGAKGARGECQVSHNTASAIRIDEVELEEGSDVEAPEASTAVDTPSVGGSESTTPSVGFTEASASSSTPPLGKEFKLKVCL